MTPSREHLTTGTWHLTPWSTRAKDIKTDDGWWMMYDGWCMMNDRWWMMDDGWWIVGDESNGMDLCLLYKLLYKKFKFCHKEIWHWLLCLGFLYNVFIWTICQYSTEVFVDLYKVWINQYTTCLEEKKRKKTEPTVFGHTKFYLFLLFFILSSFEWYVRTLEHIPVINTLLWKICEQIVSTLLRCLLTSS